MLVLTRKTQEQIQIGNNITITILRVKGQSVQVGIEAPREVRVLRGELKAEVAQVAEESLEAIEEQSHRAALAGAVRNPPAFERREAFGPRMSPVRSGKQGSGKQGSGKQGLSAYMNRRRPNPVACVPA